MTVVLTYSMPGSSFTQFSKELSEISGVRLERRAKANPMLGLYQTKERDAYSINAFIPLKKGKPLQLFHCGIVTVTSSTCNVTLYEDIPRKAKTNGYFVADELMRVAAAYASTEAKIPLEANGKKNLDEELDDFPEGGP